MTIADQRATQKLLQQALTVLKGLYEKAALMQAAQHQDPGFKSYSTKAASGGVLGMLQQIINNAKATEAEAIRGEENAQKAYEDFVNEANGYIEAKSKVIVNKSEEKAKRRSTSRRRRKRRRP